MFGHTQFQCTCQLAGQICPIHGSHIDREIIRKLDEILAQNETIRSDQLHFRDIIMATLAQVQSAQSDETTSITALAARVAALPQPAATATDLDGLLSTAEANKASVDAIAPTPAT